MCLDSVVKSTGFIVLVFCLCVTGAPLSAQEKSATSLRKETTAKKAKRPTLVLRNERIALATDTSELLAKVIFQNLNYAVDNLWRTFRISKLPEKKRKAFWPTPCLFVLFSTKRDYQEFVRKSQGPNAPALKTSSFYSLFKDRALVVMHWTSKSGAEKPTQTLRHEMGHVFLTRYVRMKPLPPWMQEGFAQWFEFHGVKRSARLQARKRKARLVISRAGKGWFERLAAKSAIDPTDYDAYDESFVVGSYLIRTFGALAFGRFATEIAKGTSLPAAMLKCYGMRPEDLEKKVTFYSKTLF